MRNPIRGPRGRRFAAVLVAVLSAVGAVTVSQAARATGTPTLSVTSDGPAKLWSGTVRADGPHLSAVPACREVHCDKLRLRVALPANIWRNKPGGVQVAVKWDGATEGALGLFVYRGSVLAARSVAGVGIAQSVIIPSPSNGQYDVYVAYGTTYGAVDPDPVITYQGAAEVEYQPAVNPVRDLLPDLSALPQDNVTYDNPGSIFGDTAQPGQSCFDSERTEGGAKQCLRFDQVLQNKGNGPLELAFDRQAGTRQDEAVVQRIYRSDSTSYEVPAGEVTFHPVHQHYHFKGFAESDLWKAGNDGKPTGQVPAVTGEKVSFCVSDTDLISFGEKGDAALSYPAPDCLDPKRVEGNTEFFWYGLSRGWADRYNWYLPDQMIDTRGLTDGSYILFTTVDPDDKLRESDESNNCSSVKLTLTGLATATPHAQLLGVGPSCSVRPKV